MADDSKWTFKDVVRVGTFIVGLALLFIPFFLYFAIERIVKKEAKSREQH